MTKNKNKNIPINLGVFLCYCVSMEKIFHINEIGSVAKEITRILSEHKKEKKDKALFVCLFGDLGSGKTTLTKAIGEELGIKENMTSPTYVIMKKYSVSKDGFENMYHIDAYRLESPEEILPLGWNDIVENNKNLVLVEWPEKIEKYLPKNKITIKLTPKSEEEREIVLELL